MRSLSLTCFRVQSVGVLVAINLLAANYGEAQPPIEVIVTERRESSGYDIPDQINQQNAAAQEQERKMDLIRYQAEMQVWQEQQRAAIAANNQRLSAAAANDEQLKKQRYFQEFNESQRKATSLYAFLTDNKSAGFARAREIDKQVEDNKDPLYWDPNKPLIIAQMVAAELRIPPRSQLKSAPVDTALAEREAREKESALQQREIAQWRAESVAKARARGEAESTKLFTDLRTRKTVVMLPSGLCYEVIKSGDSSRPKSTDTVKIRYTGTLVDGTVIDSSGAAILEVEVSAAFDGLQQGLKRVDKGGKVRLYIPSQLAYGEVGLPPKIPPASTLIYVVELVDF